MAKTKTTKTGKTVQNASAKTIAKDVFAANPDMKEVHVTSDGTAFYTLCDARNHARSLKNKAVVSLTKAEAYASDDTEPKDDVKDPTGSGDNQEKTGDGTEGDDTDTGDGSDEGADTNDKTDE